MAYWLELVFVLAVVFIPAVVFIWAFRRQAPPISRYVHAISKPVYFWADGTPVLPVARLTWSKNLNRDHLRSLRRGLSE